MRAIFGKLTLSIAILGFSVGTAVAEQRNGKALIHIAEDFRSSAVTNFEIQDQQTGGILKLKPIQGPKGSEQRKLLSYLLTNDPITLNVQKRGSKRQLGRGINEVRLYDKPADAKKASLRANQLAAVLSINALGSVAALDDRAGVTTTKSIVALLVQFPGGTAPNRTVVTDMLFNRADSLRQTYLANSDGSLDFQVDSNNDTLPDVYGPFVVNPPSDCNFSGGLSSMAQAVNAAAAAQGINTGNWQHRVYVIDPALSCGWSGIASLGGGTAYIDSSDQSWEVVYTHEVGHNLGMHHASTDPNDDGVIDSEYADHEDFMGNPSQNMHTNGAHKSQMGYLSGASIQSVGIGQFRVSALDLSPLNSPYPQVLRIAGPSSGQYYFLSFRRAANFDASLSSTYLNRLQIHLHGGGASQTLLIRSLADSESVILRNGVTVQQVAHGADYADVQIGGTCVAGAAAVTVSPSIQTAGNSGVALAYTVTVRNNDSSLCAPTTFTLGATAPAGFNAVLANPSLQVAAGVTSSTTLTVTSPAGSLDGNYTFSATAADNDGQGTNHALAAGSGTYALVTTPPPAITNLSASRIRSSSVKLSWGAPASNIIRYDIYRGATLAGSATSLNFTPSGLASCTAYSFTVRSINQFNRESAPSNVVNVTTSGCGGGGRR